MSLEAINVFWSKKLNILKERLQKNNFAVWVAKDIDEAKKIFWEEIFNKVNPKSVSFGGSMTIKYSGLYEELKNRKDIEVIDTYDVDNLSREEIIERRRKSLLVDLFITSTNALTSDGKLVNLDGFGNRVAAITFGPKHVVLFVGRNKVVKDVDEGIIRIKEYAAITNAFRFNLKVPCTKTLKCEDCDSPQRICNYWSIVEKSKPQGRIKILLINQDLGY